MLHHFNSNAPISVAVEAPENAIGAVLGQFSQDHKPLVHASLNPSPCHPSREVYHLDFVSQFSTDVQQVSGKDDVVADTFSSLITLSPTDQSFDLSAMAAAQQAEKDLIHPAKCP
ncbi:unnamed protein product [Dicrocoelium dendriticum]|nr:unnamed protein product [Dicrocoelium dendriticum]